MPIQHCPRLSRLNSCPLWSRFKHQRDFSAAGFGMFFLRPTFYDDVTAVKLHVGFYHRHTKPSAFFSRGAHVRRRLIGVKNLLNKVGAHAYPVVADRDRCGAVIVRRDVAINRRSRLALRMTLMAFLSTILKFAIRGPTSGFNEGVPSQHFDGVLYLEK